MRASAPVDVYFVRSRASNLEFCFPRNAPPPMEGTMPRGKRWRPSDEDDDLIFAVCHKFLYQVGKTCEPDAAGSSSSGDSDASDDSGKPVKTKETARRGAAAAVAEWLKEEWDRPDLNRERIYPLFWEAVRRNLLFLQPPPEKALAIQLRKAYNLGDYEGEIHVVNARNEIESNHLNTFTADLVHSLIAKVSKAKESKWRPSGEGDEEADAIKVHLGMGAGYAAAQVAKRLADRLRSDPKHPTLVLHALSSGGFLVNDPHKAPVTYFSYFSEFGSNTKGTIEYVALYSQTVVNDQEYKQLQLNPGIRKSFEQKTEIDIVISSLADGKHKHGLLVQYLNHLVSEGELDISVLENMRKAGWCGDVQFRPYSETGPLLEECPVRAVTLFEINELVEMAKKDDRYVVIVAGPCGECGEPKVDAIHPLLKQKTLRLWTHFVTDAQTARRLLQHVDEENRLAHYEESERSASKQNDADQNDADADDNAAATR